MKDIRMTRTQIFYLGLICLVASLGGFLFGFDTAVISGTVSFVRDFYSLSDLELGWFTGSALMGCVGGALVSGKLGDSFGRKPVLVVAGALFFISAIGSAYPPSFTLLIVARIIGGFGVGIASVAAPLYISEFAPAKYRGRLVALYQLSIVTGIILAYLSNWLLLGASENASFKMAWLQKAFAEDLWRGMFLVETLPAALFFVMMLMVPETPRWLILNNREERGLGVLKLVQPIGKAQHTMQEIMSSALDQKASIRELWQPGIRKALVIGIALSVFGQLTGVNIVVYYGPSILESAGLNIGGALGYQVGLGVINFVFTVISMFIIDKFGRRPLLVGGMSAVALMLVTTAFLFLFKVPATWIVISLGLYIGAIAISISAVIWVITPEIFPNRLRGRAMSIATFANWSTNALVAIAFPWLISNLGLSSVFFSFAAICVLGVITFYNMVPETKGKTLEEIETLWVEK